MTTLRPQPTPALPTSRPLGLLLSVAVLCALTIAAQYVARELGNARQLGHPLVTPPHMAWSWCLGCVALCISGTVIVILRARAYWRLAVGGLGVSGLFLWCSLGPVYSPMQFVGWMIRFRAVAALAPFLHHGLGVAVAAFLVSITVLLAMTQRTTIRPPSTSHGSAQWGTGEALYHDRGLLLGRVQNHLLRYRGDGHLVTVAPTRSGKGVSVVVPNLLTYRGSMIVSDPKGENYAMTARRRSEMGSVVHAFDPFDLVGGTATYNPLADIQITQPDAVDDARLLADMLVVVEGRETGEQAFWNEEARALLAGLILYVAASEPPERRTLTYVRALLTLPPHLLAQLLTRMSESNTVNGLVARSAARLLQKADKERSGVISSAQSHTHFLDSPRMERVLHTSTVDFALLKRARLSVYLVLPPDRMDTYHRWLRLMVASALLHVIRTPGQPRERVVFLLDEFAHLGRMRPVERDMALVGGYGASFWLLLQDMSQLKAIYPESWPTFLANADVLQTFGTNDWETAEYISKMTGDATIWTESDNRSRGISHGKHGSRQEQAARTHAERGRRLLLPDEVRRLEDRQVLFVRRMAPVLADMLDYRTDLPAQWYDPNPLFQHVA